MKKPSRFLRIIGVMGLLGTIVAALIGPTATASAQTELPIPFDPDFIFDFDNPDFDPAINVIYYPWVANDDESTGLGPADTSITVQNLSVYGGQIYIFKGVGGGTWEYVTTAALAAGASKTFSAASLDIAEGEGNPIAVAGYGQFEDPIDEDDFYNTLINYFDHDGDLIELEERSIVLSKPAGVDGDFTQVTVCTAMAVFVEDEESDEQFDVPAPFAAATDIAAGITPDGLAHPAYAAGDFPNNYPLGDSFVAWQTQEELQGVLDGVNPGGQLVDPFGGLNADGDCADTLSFDDADDLFFLDAIPLGGVAKQAVDGEELPYTTSADTAVSGYNAFNQFEIASFDEWYVPIVQTNCGPGGCWNTILRVANLGNVNNAVTVRFFPADDGSGSLQTGFQLESLVDGGDVWHIDISDWVPEGWVGSAHVFSDGAVFAMADRVKVGYNMWLTTTGSSAPAEAALQNEGGFGDYVLFAPDVRLDFYGWNTGINVANISDMANNVNVQYFGQYGGSAQTLTQQLAPQGMTYFYDPSIGAQDNSNQDPTQDVNADLIGSALIWSDYPVAVAVDATKYPESTTAADANVFQGFTYNATANIYNWQFVPLVQKGNPTTGQGATSGIQIMNPTSVATQVDIYWVNQSGFQADNNGISSLAVPAYANGFAYTNTQHNLPNGFYGSAVVHSTQPILALSTQVDYQVQFDGTAAWNAFNPCGFYRTTGWTEVDDEIYDCDFGDPFEQPQGGSVTKIFVDEDGETIAGVEALLYNTTTGWFATGVSNVNGEILWTNAPVGDYELFVIGGPEASVAEELEDEGPFYQYFIDFDDDGVYDEGEGINGQYWIDEDDDNIFDEEEELDLGLAADEFQLEFGDDVVIENELVSMGAVKFVSTGVADLEVCVYVDTDGDGTFDEDDGSGTDTDIDAEVVCGTTDDDGDVVFEGLAAGDYFIVVGSLEFGPETFEAGGVYLNDLTQDIAATGFLTKTLLFENEAFAEAIEDGTYNLQSTVFICEAGVDVCNLADSFETLGGFEDLLELGVGPEGEAGFVITTRVPVGEYIVCALGSVSGDFDADPLTPDDELFFFDCLDSAASEAGDVDQLIYDPPFFGASSFAPDAPAITVYEDIETRVFNYFHELVTGDFDAFVRDDLTDLPIEGAEVCLYDEDNVLVDCALTDVDGIAHFEDTVGGQYTVNASADGYEAEAQVVDYGVVLDAMNGGLEDTTEATADSVSALDPQGAILDVQTLIGATPVNGITVSLFAASPLDDPASGFCGSTELLALATSGSDDDEDGAAPSTTEGVAEFGVAPGDYCAQATIAGGIVAGTGTADADDPDNDIDIELSAAFDPATQGVLDVTVIPGAIDTNPGFHLVEVYVSAVGDTAGDNGTCNGALTTSGTTTPNADGEGEIDFILAANTYCIAAYSGDFGGLGDPTVAAGVTLVAGDLPGDVNVTIETS